MTNAIFVCPKHISILHGCAMQKAYKIYNHLLDALAKTKIQGITIKEYCKYYQADERTVDQIVNKK